MLFRSYLYLEDGVPIRSTGFFNHNALYEINVPQAGSIEVNRGPGTALYGSDAIGGIVNVLTRTPPAKAEFNLSGDVGPWGWGRVLLGGGNRKRGLLTVQQAASTSAAAPDTCGAAIDVPTASE